MDFRDVETATIKSIFGKLGPAFLGAYLLSILLFNTILPISQYAIFFFIVLIHVIFLSLIPRIVVEKLVIQPKAVISPLVEKWKMRLKEYITVYTTENVKLEELTDRKCKILEKILEYSFEEKAKLTLSILFNKLDNSSASHTSSNVNPETTQKKNETNTKKDNQTLKLLRSKEVSIENNIAFTIVTVPYGLYFFIVLLILFFSNSSSILAFEFGNIKLENFEVSFSILLFVLTSLLLYTLSRERKKLLSLYRTEIYWIGSETQRFTTKIESELVKVKRKKHGTKRIESYLKAEQNLNEELEHHQTHIILENYNQVGLNEIKIASKFNLRKIRDKQFKQPELSEIENARDVIEGYFTKGLTEIEIDRKLIEGTHRHKLWSCETSEREINEIITKLDEDLNYDTIKHAVQTIGKVPDRNRKIIIKELTKNKRLNINRQFEKEEIVQILNNFSKISDSKLQTIILDWIQILHRFDLENAIFMWFESYRTEFKQLSYYRFNIESLLLCYFSHFKKYGLLEIGNGKMIRLFEMYNYVALIRKKRGTSVPNLPLKDSESLGNISQNSNEFKITIGNFLNMLSDVDTKTSQFFALTALKLCKDEKKKLSKMHLFDFLDMLAQKVHEIQKSSNFCHIIWILHNLSKTKQLFEIFSERIYYSSNTNFRMTFVSLFFKFDSSKKALFISDNCKNFQWNYNSKIDFKFLKMDIMLNSNVENLYKNWIRDLKDRIANTNYLQLENSILSYSQDKGRILFHSFFSNSMDTIYYRVKILNFALNFRKSDEWEDNAMIFEVIQEVTFSLFVTIYYYSDKDEFPNISTSLPLLENATKHFLPGLQNQILNAYKNL